MTRRVLRAGAACCCVAGALASAAQPVFARDTRPVRPVGSSTPLGMARLSDERTVTRLAHAVTRARVLSRPIPGASRVARLHHLTEDGPLETYLALESRVDAQRRSWLRIRIPGRPNGRTGWVRREALGPLFTVTTRLRVNRRLMRAVLYRHGRRIWSSPIGIGAPATPTPSGRYWIRSRLRALGGGTVYGPWAFGTAAYSRLSDWPGGGVVGIHGTNAPWLIPGRPSHGCIRVPNAKIRVLARLMPVGTPVLIL